ncbi:4-hydroxythreonine-4-phosphate dehydrogenase PdxA [Prevotella melaninogenica]|uniref:PdxA family dehydrogenase n=1 Tax=Prevotella TaxID=838 RepID=UPI0003AD6B46|nr:MULTISPECIES: 4-hydroxythreonine-4-phosphate dehydrogenase PdxA [Prevotella]ERJ77614.1 pyridoxal phosphate biosynthetic protein PdxA [Prevotella sp. F0091]QUB73735.1 4-hydroxythreonine-4-phosphate dehydrogenase PdxA [Prevotella melaninogenica]
MNNNKKIRVAITHGDTNGIGYELIFKTFAEPEMLDLCTPIIYGSPKVATYHRNALDMEANFTIIKDASEAQNGRLNLLPVFDDEIKVELGVASEESGVAGLRAIDKALDDYRQGLFDVLVTAPIDNNEHFHFSGQSRYIEDHLETEEQGLSILINDGLRIALATRNLPLRQVAESITKASIVNNATVLFKSLRRDFRLSCPRIAMLGLNPKAGDNGLLGSEEQEIILPAIDELVDNDIQAFGPYAADTFFGCNHTEHFDGILAMYYEQGLAPFRTLSSCHGITYTAGLPLVRTSAEIPNSLSLAGKGIADELPFRHAIYLAIDIFRNRIEYDAPMSNPLPKLYKERRDESDKVRFAIPRKREDRSPNNGENNKAKEIH